MPKTTRKTPSFEGVAAGQTATLRCSIGLTFHQLLITFANITLAQMNEIRVLANGETIMRYTSGTQLDAINQYEGRAGAAASNVLTIDFDRYNMRTRAAEEVTALGTGDREDENPIVTLTVEIDIDALAAGVTLAAKAIQSASRILGPVKKVRNYRYPGAAIGDHEISDLPKGEIFNKVAFGGHAANAYTALRIERDNFVVFERSVAENEVVQIDGVRTPQADLVVYDPTENGHGAEGLTTARVGDLRFIQTLTNPGVVPVTVESIGPLNF